MKVARTVSELQNTFKILYLNPVGFVPTMGALHEGHLALVAEGLEQADKVLVTIFVNAKQFGANEDLSRYPRDEAGDVAKLADAGAHLIFAPSPEEVYTQGLRFIKEQWGK